MRIEIRKRSDGSGLLRCTRADGSVTWQKERTHGIHFALHDLTHLAVESTLGLRDGFYGLVAQGWAIEDTTGKGARGPLPPGAVEVESLVGFFDAERASGSLWTAAEFNEAIVLHSANYGRPSMRAITEAEIQAIRKRRSELFRQWMDLEDGADLIVEFDPCERRKGDLTEVGTR